MGAKPPEEIKPILHLCGLCVRFKCMPGPGSLLEQDSLHIWLLTLYLDALEERQKRDAKRQEQEAKAAKAKRG